MLQISNELRRQYVKIIGHIIDRRKESYTQKEVAEILNISRQKYIDFEKIKHYDFILLDQVAGLVCYSINLEHF